MASIAARLPTRLGLIAVATLAMAPVARGEDGGAPKLSLPIACEPGRTCFLQSHVDLDPGPGARDFACGSATYEGHEGTDFRVLSSAAAKRDRVQVIASADGTVKGGRDGMEDVFSTGPDDTRIKERECGNGVVIDHGSGWETQYCHLMKGSVLVKPGDKVTRGQQVGLVGNSGLAEFAHVHLAVRKDGKVIDPYTGLEPSESCAGLAATSGGLWTREALAAFPYVNGEIIAAGFSGRTPRRDELELDPDAVLPTAGTPEIYFYARVANILPGDRVRMRLLGPGGFKHESASKPLDRARQMHLEFAFARTSKGSPVPLGAWSGKAELVRGDRVISARDGAFELR